MKNLIKILLITCLFIQNNFFALESAESEAFQNAGAVQSQLNDIGFDLNCDQENSEYQVGEIGNCQIINFNDEYSSDLFNQVVSILKNNSFIVTCSAGVRSGSKNMGTLKNPSYTKPSRPLMGGPLENCVISL